jgi:hypothetical protein
MAACLISVTGTVGVIRVNYKISSVPYSIETSVGDFYIEDTATDVTYTTLSGDLVASSGCLTITELPPVCYKISWEGIATDGYIANAIILGNDTITIANTTFPESRKDLITNINNANDDRVKVIGYKFNLVGYSKFNSYDSSYIVKVLGSEVPILRVRNADDTGYIHIHGVVQPDCLPQTGFTIVDPCYSTLPPAL